MEKSIKFICGALVLLFIMQSCSKQETPPFEQSENLLLTAPKEIENYDFTIVDRDDWCFEFNHKNNYSLNALFGVGQLSWISYGTTYTDVASFIHDKSTDVYTILAYEAKRGDYLLYLMDWNSLTSTYSDGAYNFMLDGGYYYTIDASLTNGSVESHIGGADPVINNMGKGETETLKEIEDTINPEDYTIIINDSDNWKFYLNKYSFERNGCSFYTGRMSWVYSGIEYIGEASAIYYADKDILSLVGWDDKRSDALQYNMSFISEDGIELFGHYIFTRNNPYYYKIWAGLIKGQIGYHIAEESNSPLLKNQLVVNCNEKKQ